MTAPAAGSRPRPARRALDDLSLPIDSSSLEVLAAAGPDWLAAERRAAFEAWASLPPESNLLYTPYIDLRLADLAERPHRHRGRAAGRDVGGPPR